jgi:hypothetical protein
MWGRAAAPEENRGTGVRPHLRKSGLAFRGRCNGPPQGLVCPPPGLESPGPSLPAASTLPAEEAVSEGKGLEHIAASGAPRGCPTIKDAAAWRPASLVARATRAPWSGGALRLGASRSQKSEIRNQEGERWSHFYSSESKHKALPADL